MSIKIFSNYTIDYLVNRLVRSEEGFEISKCNFGQSEMEAMSQREKLTTAIFFVDFIKFYEAFAKTERQDFRSFLRTQVEYNYACIENLSKHSGDVYCFLLTPSLIPLDGIFDYGEMDSDNAMYEFNRELTRSCSSLSNVFSLNINKEVIKDGLNSFYDYENWIEFRSPYSANGLLTLSNIIKNQILKKSQNIKLVITDLDNTFWSGIVGDDGVHGIEVGHETRNGVIHHDYQIFLNRLKNLGIMIGVVSKNEFSLAEPALDDVRNPFLKKDFFDIRCNWEPKSENIIKMCETMNIGQDAVLFIDDSDYEIAEVSANTQITNAVKFENEESKNPVHNILYNLDIFPRVLTAEDFEKSKLYAANKERDIEKQRFSSVHDFLMSQDLRAEFVNVSEDNIKRVVQLIGKTNQFITSNTRYSHEGIFDFMESPNTFTWAIRLDDKIGSYGIVGIVMGTQHDQFISVDQWVMSCRAFNRTLEHFILCKLRALFAQRKIVVNFEETNRNLYVKTFLESNLQRSQSSHGLTFVLNTGTTLEHYVNE